MYGKDHLSSIRAVIASPGGQNLNHVDDDAYGNPSTATGSRANWTDFRYAGLFYHQPSGLYLATYRAYDPLIGHWLSRDPIKENGGNNLYAYVGGDPVSGRDPNGLQAYQIGINIGGGGGVAGSYEVGITYDSNGNIGICDTATGGLGAGGEAGVSLSATYTPGAGTIDDLAGFGRATGSANSGQRVIGSFSYSIGQGGTTSHSLNIGIGAGASGSVGYSNTAVSNIFQPLPPPWNDPYPGLTNALQQGLANFFGGLY